MISSTSSGPSHRANGVHDRMRHPPSRASTRTRTSARSRSSERLFFERARSGVLRMGAAPRFRGDRRRIIRSSSSWRLGLGRSYLEGAWIEIPRETRRPGAQEVMTTTESQDVRSLYGDFTRTVSPMRERRVGRRTPEADGGLRDPSRAIQTQRGCTNYERRRGRRHEPERARPSLPRSHRGSR